MEPFYSTDDYVSESAATDSNESASLLGGGATTPPPTTSSGSSSSESGSSGSGSSSGGSGGRGGSSSSSRVDRDDDDDDDIAQGPLSSRFALPCYVDPSDLSDITVTTDVDSIVVATRTLEPFVCRAVAKVATHPRLITRSRQTKLLKYLGSREEHRLPRKAPFCLAGENIRRSQPWYEFCLGEIDDRRTYVAFQLARSFSFFKREERRLNEKGEPETDLRLVCRAFVARVTMAAMSRLDATTTTAMGGPWAYEGQTSQTYRV